MASLPTLPRISWLKRLSTLTAAALVISGVAVLFGWLLDTGAFLQLQAELVATKINTGVGLLLFGVIFLSLRLGFRRVAWASLAPAALGALTLWEYASRRTVEVGQLLPPGTGPKFGDALSRLPPVVAAGFFLSGLSVAWLGMRNRPRYRTPLLALVGSISVAIGFSTALGHALKLPTMYSWGTPPIAASLSAATLLLLGAAQLAFAWREAVRSRPGAPVWVPIPVIVASTALTIIFAAGLRNREVEYGRANTEIQLNAFATAISEEFDRQLAAFGGLSRRWRQEEDPTSAPREAEAKTQLNDSPGCYAIAWLDANRTARRVYPPRGVEAVLAVSHDRDPIRVDALDAAQRTLGPVLTNSFPVPGLGDGFALYAPIVRAGRAEGYVVGEFAYRRFLAAIDRRLKIAPNYRVLVEIDGVRVYPPSVDPPASEAQSIGKAFALHERRVRIELSPTATLLRSNRRFLPELALMAGLGITLLLGLSVHLARTASARLRAANHSNKSLLAENEERRRIEGMLNVSDERLRLALDSTLIGIFEWQLASNRVYYSPGIWAIVGYDPAEKPLNFDVWATLVHPEDLARYRETWDLQLKGERPLIDPEYRIRVADGSWRWIYARSRSFTANDRPGIPTRIVGTVQDTTARKLSEHALRESQSAARKLSLVASRTDNLVIIATPDGTIEWVNESFLRVMEYSLAEVVGRGPQFFMTGPDSDMRIVRRVKSAMERGEGISTDLINYSKSGRKFHVHLEIQPVRNEQGVLENFIAIEADITARVATETALRRAKSEADDASRAKSEFLASMSHEIRTPMNGVIGMTSLLLETPLSSEQSDFVATIRTSGEALLTIINDILDFSKIESGKMELERQPVDVQSCIEEAFDLFAMNAAAKNLELAYFVHVGVPDWIAGDITRLRQVLVNLVNNAVKFTPGGAVAVEVRVAPPSSEHPFQPGRLWVEFAVKDSGIGIPQERVDRLFKPFSQVDSSTTRKYGGTGLGLAICHRLTTLMGGTISVQSERGVGSTFTFALPTERVAPPADASPFSLPETFRGKEILCVDDDPTTLRRMARLLSEQGGLPVTVDNNSAAISFLAKGTSPAAAVLDFSLLDRPDGEALKARIASLEIPTVLLLPIGKSSGDLGERRFVSTAAKPLKTQSLFRALTNVGKTQRSDPEAPPQNKETRILAHEVPLDVLIVEDNPVNRKVALRFLERLGYRADTAGNGIEAIAALQSRDYDLVFMDLQMPEMDGFEATRQIRQRIPADRQPRIVALTANALQGDRELCLAAGMDDYVTKPVKIQEIAAIVAKHFKTPKTETPTR